ncbi:hypothetical protein [Clostridium sp. C2-6-12]|uniref:hypothetical protein n=1 Tax=Clostridium sp. C2-6-12 TaxID=2698832 RepID=UPI001A9AF9C5|nr:hypothetical protein [Clostridium sp. C2-6-12]
MQHCTKERIPFLVLYVFNDIFLINNVHFTMNAEKPMGFIKIILKDIPKEYHPKLLTVN